MLADVCITLAKIVPPPPPSVISWINCSRGLCCSDQYKAVGLYIYISPTLIYSPMIVSNVTM